jgi:hypothetical protein
MASTGSPAQTDQAAIQDLAGLEEIMSQLARERRKDPGAAEVPAANHPSALPEVDAPEISVRSPERLADPERPSLVRQASRAVVRFLIAVFIGVAATLAWQSYGDEAKQMLASGSPQHASALFLQPTTPAADAAPQPSSPPMPQAAVDAPGPAPVAVVAAGATPGPDPQQIEAITRDLATVRQMVEQLAAGQERIDQRITDLQATEQEIRQKLSAAVAARPAAAPVRKPVPPPPAAPTVPQASAAPPPPPPAGPAPARPPAPLR